MSPYIPRSSLVEIDHFSHRRDCRTRASVSDARDDVPPPCGFIARGKKVTSASIKHLYFSSARFCRVRSGVPVYLFVSQSANPDLFPVIEPHFITPNQSVRTARWSFKQRRVCVVPVPP